MSDAERFEDVEADENEAAEDPGWPIAFLVGVGLVALYLVWRFVQLGGRFFDWVL